MIYYTEIPWWIIKTFPPGLLVFDGRMKHDFKIVLLTNLIIISKGRAIMHKKCTAVVTQKKKKNGGHLRNKCFMNLYFFIQKDTKFKLNIDVNRNIYFFYTNTYIYIYTLSNAIIVNRKTRVIHILIKNRTRMYCSRLVLDNAIR